MSFGWGVREKNPKGQTEGGGLVCTATVVKALALRRLTAKGIAVLSRRLGLPLKEEKSRFDGPFARMYNKLHIYVIQKSYYDIK